MEIVKNNNIKKKKFKWVKKIAINNFYLCKVDFEDGYDNRLGTNNKIRPVLILDKFFDIKEKQEKYIICPLYSVPNSEMKSNKFKSKYYFHVLLPNWLDQINKYKNVKFKVNQLKIVKRDKFIKINLGNNFRYKKLILNSPILNQNLYQLNKKIEEYNKFKLKNNKNCNFSSLYLRRKDNKSFKNLDKKLKFKNNTKEYIKNLK